MADMSDEREQAIEAGEPGNVTIAIAKWANAERLPVTYDAIADLLAALFDGPEPKAIWPSVLQAQSAELDAARALVKALDRRVQVYSPMVGRLRFKLFKVLDHFHTPGAPDSVTAATAQSYLDSTAETLADLHAALASGDDVQAPT